MPVDPATVSQASTQSARGGPLKSAAPNARRRRLLVGAVGALPSVYTLASGAQVAAHSAMACWAHEPQTPPVRFTRGSDDWVRSTVYSGDYAGYQAHCVTSPQRPCNTPPLHPDKIDEAGDGTVWIVNSGGPSGYDYRVIAGPNNQVTKVGRTPPAQGLVYVDRDATFATLDPNGRPFLRPVTASCWASALAGRTTQLG